MSRQAFQKTTLLFVSVALSLGFLECALRWSRLVPVVGLHSVSAEDYERIPGFWEPGQDFVNLQIPELPHRIRTNSLGLRGPETTLEPTDPRVLCLGDSFTFGDFVDDEDTLPAQLGARLEGRAELLNGGVGGTTIVDQREFMKRYLALRPDVVLLLFYENDVNDLVIEPPMHVQFARNRELKSGVLGAIYAALRDTALFNALLHVQGALRARRAVSATRPASGTDASDGTPPPWLGPAVERYAAEATALRDLLEARGIGLVVAAFPHPHVVSGERKLDRIGPVSRALAERRMQVVDLTPALRAADLPLTEIYLLPHDGHPSRRGYAIAAEVLEPHLRRALESREERVPARSRGTVSDDLL